MKSIRFSLVLSAYCLVLTSSSLYAEVPHLIRYQGQAVDSNGVPLEGPYSLTFRLYDAETGGTEVWKEPQANVALAGGHFSVLLGQVTPLTSMDWSQPRWLSVQVNGEPELTPRQRITSVPLAITAEKLAVPVTTSTITDDENSLVPSGAIILWDGAGCPAGYTRAAALDGKFLAAGAAYNAAAGGSNTINLQHNHGAVTGGTAITTAQMPAHTHTVTSNPSNPGTANRVGRPDGGNADATYTTISTGGGATHDHSIGNALLAAQDIRPAFAAILLCKKD